MAQRFTTVLETAESAGWTPLADFFLQVDQPDGCFVDVLGRADAGAPYAVLKTISVAEPRIIKFSAVPDVKLRVRDNAGGGTVTVWDDS